MGNAQCSTNTSLTFQKTNGIGRPGCVTAFSVLYQTFPFPNIPPVPYPLMWIRSPVIMKPAW
jgi:hypothetical protein